MNIQNPPQILIIDFGSQYAALIARTLREIGFRSAVFSPIEADQWLENNTPKAIILSGGDKSVTKPDAPIPSEKIWSLGIPILGICYGMHLMSLRFGGSITLTSEKEHKEYGPHESNFVPDNTGNGLFSTLSVRHTVHMSHGDSVISIPPGFDVIATPVNQKCTIHAMSCVEKKLWAVQFHPEVVHTNCGRHIFRNFVISISKCDTDWYPEDIVKEVADRTLTELAGRSAMLGFSGGVDSTTLARVLAPVMKSKLRAICIDAGQFREGEIEEIRSNAKHAGVWLSVVKAKHRFCSALATATDAEIKRKIFKRLYRKILLEAAKRLKIGVIIQGSLATDFIESGAAGQSALIKSHHNVGKFPGLEEVHPFRDLFKYEVRDLARALRLPTEVCERKPSPGPGLFLRVIGKPVTLSRLTLLRWADREVTRVLVANNWTTYYNQLVVALICVNTVGVKGDARVYAPSILVRAVTTTDFMTAKGVYFPEHIMRQLIEAVTVHPDICRVWQDSMDKPPGPVELE